MLYKNVLSGSVATAILLLAGCSNVPPEFYVMPDPAQPAARVKITGGFGWYVQRTDLECSRLGQSDARKVTYLAGYPEKRYPSESPPHVEVTLPAGLSTFRAGYGYSNTSCLLDFDSLLLAGRKYEMKLEYDYGSIFFGRGQCKAIIVDVETGAPAPTFSTSFKWMFFPNRLAIRDEASCRRKAEFEQSGFIRNSNG